MTARSTTARSRPLETNAGVTTSWLPMSTAHPSVAGCESSFWKVVPTLLAGWDPGYGLFVQPGLSCHPQQVTSWWDQNHSISFDDEKTRISLGPVVCPQAYTTAATDARGEGSTFVGCCPSAYSFVSFMEYGDTGQCTSPLSPGQVVRFATSVSNATGYTTSTSTVQSSSQAYAIPVNGWIFAESTNGGAADPTSPGSQSEPTSGSTDSGLSTGAKVGLGVGVPLGAIALGLIGAALFFARRKRATELKPEPPPSYAPKEGMYSQYGPPAASHHRGSHYPQQSGPYEIQSASPPAELPSGRQVVEMA